MGKFLLGLALVFTFVGCTKSDLCDQGKKVGSLVAAHVAVELDCKNVAAIQADIEKRLVELKVCEDPAAQGVIGEAVCSPMVNGLVSALLTQLPATWECSGGSASDSLKAKLIEKCQQLL